ncbi:hypothetical protein Cgig2_030500 [Carnegiea gigantea]|uniref:Protein kinase domain-containing protein n=1 Tax=Carnegiea gigantea TaxID=171969 RepID=A0A9Q1JFV4_9CARY|nr:hypothetical protein Cgig2_030500 [Carnegiea gigantea]
MHPCGSTPSVLHARCAERSRSNPAVSVLQWSADEMTISEPSARVMDSMNLFIDQVPYSKYTSVSGECFKKYRSIIRSISSDLNRAGTGENRDVTFHNILLLIGSAQLKKVRMGSGKIRMYGIEVILVAMLWLSIIPIMPSSAQQGGLTCWKKISDCLGKNLNQTSNPEFNEKSSSFNASKFLCCPLIQEQAQSHKLCFCTMDLFIHQNPSSGNGTLTVLKFCNITDSDSLASFDAFCSDGSSPRQAPAGSTPSPAVGKKNVITAVAVSSAVLLVLMALGIILYGVKARKKPNEPANPPPPFDPPSRDDIITPESLQYEFGALKEATNDFSNDHKIGQGGFGVVYRGTLPNGQVVAVKRLSRGSWQGDTEFKNEAALLAKLQHRNLVRLVGFCLAKEERLLVYEFMQNKSLDYLLFDPEKQKQLTWPRRYNIVKGIARGMLYLHEDSPTRIIHRDMKASNVLLDAEMNPKIADFGMAKIFHVEQTRGATSKIIGTYGFMAPEYLAHGQFSVKSDVYSFGVLVLEIVSGRSVTSLIYQFGSAGENLLRYAWICFRDGRPLDFIDPTLRDSYSKNEIIRCIHIGLLCVQEDMRIRPSMERVVLMFNSDSDVGALLLPLHPGILRARYAEATEQSSITNTSSMPWSGIVVGTVWLSTILIMPSSAQQCWKNIADCLDEHFNQTSKPEFDSNSPSFNGTEFFCCPLIQEAAQNEKPCFCEMNTFVHQNPSNNTGVLKLLNFCGVTDSESLDSFDAFCSASRNDVVTPESLQYEFGALKAATNNFSNYHRIQGDGFGVGTLPNGKEVAIKRLSNRSWQGDQEFMNEVTLVAKLQHRNLVRLLGFCLVNEERLLVCEFAHNRSLDYILFGYSPLKSCRMPWHTDTDQQKQLDWSMRCKIIGGIARGLLYLHEDSPTRIIHRDLKAANILLDTEMNPKISDFGMARIFHFEQTHGDTRRIIGTHGYMAPEYLLLGQFSIKSDVYSFGVLILEIVSGKKISSLMYPSGSAGENLPSSAWRCFRDGRPLDFMDPTLRHSHSRNEVIRCIHLGLQCIQDDPRRRPSMGKVVVMLNSDSDVGGLLLPECPGGLQARYAEQSTTNSISHMPWSGNEGLISEPNPR